MASLRPKTSRPETTGPLSSRISSSKSKNTNNILWAVLIILLCSTAAMGYQLYRLQADPSQLSKAEINNIVEKVGRLIVLPENEQPTVATVTDPEQLKDQAFFLNAKKGDKVLIYAQAKKAILYDPVADRIVEVAPINSTPSSSTESGGGLESDTKAETDSTTGGNTTP